MCNGTLMDKLISFSIPLMLSGILQLMFNAVDIIVVGRFAGSESLAAVGSTTALINVFTNLFIGISLGSNVLAARYYAAGKEREMSETVHSSLTLALISGILMAFAGLFFSRTALEWMGTPDDVIDLAALYMKIYFIGMPFFMLYNYGAAILRAVGDTKRPLLFLVVSGLVNAGLNMIFCHLLPYGGRRRCDCNCHFSAAFLYYGFDLPVSDAGLLSIPLFEAGSQEHLCPPDFPGRNPGRNSEHRHQLFQRPAAVLGQFLWLDCNGRIHRGEQYLRIFIHFSQLCDAGVHEFYQPELRRGKNEADGPRFNRLSDFILCVFPDHGLLCMVFSDHSFCRSIRRVLRLFRAALRF